MFTSSLTVSLVVAAFFGLAAGSFLNVLIIRTRRGTSPWRGRSRCLSCGRELRWWEMIPVGSFIWLRARCRACRRPLDWQYPVVEAGTAVLFMAVTWRWGFSWLMLLGWLVAAVMLAVAVYDARWSKLPDEFSLTLAVTGAMFAVVNRVPVVDLVSGATGGALFFALQYLLSRGRWVGSGDILLGAALGCLLGWRMLTLALLVAYIVGALAAAIILLTAKRHLGNKIPFAPYLVMGGFAAWLWGDQIINWYFNHALFR